MRITYLHQYFKTPSMPGGSRPYEMARRLVDHGHSVHVIASDTESSGKVYETNESGIRISWIPVAYSNESSYAERYRAFMEFAIRSSQLAARERPDVIFASSTPLSIALPGIFAKWRTKAPMVFEVRDLWPEAPIALGAIKNPLLKFAAKSLERLAYHQSSHVVALSPSMGEAIENMGHSTKKISIIPNSCDFGLFEVDSSLGGEFRSNLSWLGSRPLVLYAGTLGLVNGVGYIVDVAAHMLNIDEEVRFLLVGNGRERDEIKRKASDLGVLNRNLFMMESVQKSSMPAIMSAASITTSTVIDVPELDKNSANKFFDSLASSRPIAINHDGWQAELIREHDIGLVLDPSDTESAARQLASSLRDDEWLVDAGERAAQLGRRRFDRDDLAAQLAKVLESVVNTKVK